MVRDGVVLADAAEPESRSHAKSLPGLVARALAEAGVELGGLHAVAVSIGPGSFTGLRIGLGWAKGVAFAARIPLVTVPTLEALAWAADAAAGEQVCAALDARKGEVYAALFAATAAGPRRLSEDLALRPVDLAARLERPCVLVGDAGSVYGDVLGARATIRPFATHHPRGGIVARLGWQRLLAGAAANPGEVEPVYVRPPEAELVRFGSR